MPAAGDTVYIDHAVVYDLNDSSTSYNYIYVRTGGSLTHASGQQTTIKCYRLRIEGGKYEMTPQSRHIIERRYENENAGYIWLHTNSGSQFIAIGSVPNPLQQVRAIANNWIQVDDSSGFGIGDYIAVYNNQNITWTNKNDEGLIVSFVEPGKIYTVKRVGPTGTTTASHPSSVNYLQVNDARPFEFARYITVIGTAGFWEIDYVDRTNNRVYLKSQLGIDVGSGQTVAECGFDKTHTTSEVVYKLCTVTTVAVSSGTTSITVSNPGSIVAGDDIWIEDSSMSSSETRYQGEIVTVQSVNGNIITFTPALTRAHEQGVLVGKLTRDCVIEADSVYGAMVYAELETTYNNRVFDLRYVRFNNLGGNTYSTYWRGVSIRGSFHGTGGRCIIDGCSYVDAGRNYDWDGIHTNYYAYYGIAGIKNCLVINAHSGVGMAYTHQSSNLYNNICASRSYGLRSDYTLDSCDVSYNVTCGSTYGMILSAHYRTRPYAMRLDNYTFRMWHNEIRFARDPLYIDKCATIAIGDAYRFKIYKPYYLPSYVFLLPTAGYLNESAIISPVNTSVPDRDAGYSRISLDMPTDTRLVFLNQDFIRGNHVSYRARFKMSIDRSVTFNNRPTLKIEKRSTSAWDGIVDRVYLNKGDKIAYTTVIYAPSNYNGSTPQIWVYNVNDNTRTTVSIPNWVKDGWVKVDYQYTCTKPGIHYICLMFNHDNVPVWVVPPELTIYQVDDYSHLLTDDRISLPRYSYYPYGSTINVPPRGAYIRSGKFV